MKRINGPDWLAKPDEWPATVLNEPSEYLKIEAKRMKEALATSVESEESFDPLLLKHPYWKIIRINAWIARFIHNCKVSKQLRSVGPLTAVETEQQVKWWIRRGTREIQQNREFS